MKSCLYEIQGVQTSSLVPSIFFEIWCMCSPASPQTTDSIVIKNPDPDLEKTIKMVRPLLKHHVCQNLENLITYFKIAQNVVKTRIRFYG